MIDVIYVMNVCDRFLIGISSKEIKKVFLGA
jgi:hypothetical protein